MFWAASAVVDNISLREILQNQPIVMSRNCEMPGCQWCKVKQIKSQIKSFIILAVIRRSL